jgi:glycosyltransferase involved in cell wall biosynthesis
MPKISVIIPTYERAASLARAINSVLEQTFRDFEIIIVDDASKDNTREVVKAIGDQRIRYLRHERNQKEAGARNTGVSNARGEYVAFLDDDDEWLPDKLRRQVDLLDRSPPYVGVVYTGSIKIDRGNGKTFRVTPTKRGNLFEELLIHNCVGTPSTILLKRKCFETVGLFDPNIVFGPDYDMWIRLAEKYHFECIPEPLIKYYIHGERLSNNYSLMISGIEAQMKKYSRLFGLNSRGFSRRYSVLGIYHCYNGDPAKGRQALWDAIKLYPFEIRHYYNFCLSLLGAKTFKRIKMLRDQFSSIP